MSVNLIRGKRLNSFMVHDGNGYYYYKYKFAYNTNYLRCINKACPGRASCKGPLAGGVAVTLTVPHNHDANKSLAEVSQLKQKLKERSVLEPIPLKRIYEEETSNASPQLLQEVGFAEVESLMYKARRAANPKVPATLAEYGQLLVEDVEGRYAKTISDEQFFRAAISGEDVGTSIVFASQYFIDLFINSPTEVHIDGTFKTLPRAPKCYQMVTILSLHYDQVFPMFYIIMERKTSEAYEIVFSFCKALLGETPIGTIIADFESAMQIAARRVFVGADIHGCWFHYASAVFRKARKLGLCRQRPAKKAIRRLIQMAMALPLLPHEFSVEGFQFLEAFAVARGILALVEPFLKYLDRTWIKGVGPVTLSVYKQVNRTNNFHESLHMSLKRKLGVHPPIWMYTDCLRKEEDLFRRQYASLSAGRYTVRPRRKAYMAKDSQIRRSEERFSRNQNVGEFLQITAKRIPQLQEDEDENELEDEIVQIIEEPANEEEDANNEEEEDPYKGKCVICKEEKITHICIPCGHFALCEQCEAGLVAHYQTNSMQLICPLCKEICRGIFKVFPM